MRARGTGLNVLSVVLLMQLCFAMAMPVSGFASESGIDDNAGSSGSSDVVVIQLESVGNLEGTTIEQADAQAGSSNGASPFLPKTGDTLIALLIGSTAGVFLAAFMLIEAAMRRYDEVDE